MNKMVVLSRSVSELAVLLVLGGCGVMAGSIGKSPSLSWHPAARATEFCASKRAEPGANVTQCVDFGSVEEGTLPQGWMGGAGLMVKLSNALGGTKVLQHFEPRDNYQVSVPWKLTGDYTVDLSLFFGNVGDWPACHSVYAVIIGNLELGFKSQCGSGTTVSMMSTTQSLSFPLDYHWVKLVKKGDVHTLYIDGRQVLLGRYESMPNVEALTISSKDRFGLAGLSVEGGQTPSPNASKPPPNASKPQLTGHCESEEDAEFQFEMNLERGAIEAFTLKANSCVAAEHDPVTLQADVEKVFGVIWDCYKERGGADVTIRVQGDRMDVKAKVLGEELTKMAVGSCVWR